MLPVILKLQIGGFALTLMETFVIFTKIEPVVPPKVSTSSSSFVTVYSRSCVDHFWFLKQTTHIDSLYCSI